MGRRKEQESNSYMTEEEQTPKSYLIVQFSDVGSVLFTTKMDGITPLQLLALAGYLELKAKNELVQQENQRVQREADMKLLVPDKHVQVAQGKMG